MNKLENIEETNNKTFEDIINKTKTACENSGMYIEDHFADIGKMVQTDDKLREFKDYKLTRYASYLIAQNST